MIEQAVQLIGAAMVLAGFVALQLGRVRVSDVTYLMALNAAGSGMLLVVAVLDREWGFILLEVVWTGVALFGLVRASLAPRHRSASRA
ncbi:MAG: hypothetical protein R2848_09755 [Thermomicrobiales bacterium]